MIRDYLTIESFEQLCENYLILRDPRGEKRNGFYIMNFFFYNTL